MSDFITKLSELIDPEVMGDMVSARIPKKLRVAPFAKIDDTLQGVPGDTITVPAYTYIGDASDVAEGGEVAIEKMTTSTRKATIKKAMKGIGLTDEAVLSGYGNPVGEANTQLAQAIAAKVDNDCMDALQTASLIYDGSQAQISYNAIVDAVDLFEEEMGCSDKVLFIHPKQVTQLRKQPRLPERRQVHARRQPDRRDRHDRGLPPCAQQEGPADRRRLRLPHRQAGGRPRGRRRDPGADHLPQARGQH